MSTTITPKLDAAVYGGKTATVPRPSTRTHPHLRPDALQRHQDAWDVAERWRVEGERLRAERIAAREAERAAEHARSQAEQAARQQRASDRREAGLKHLFLLHGTEADWAEQREAILAADRQQRVLTADERARAANARRYG